MRVRIINLDTSQGKMEVSMLPDRNRQTTRRKSGLHPGLGLSSGELVEFGSRMLQIHQMQYNTYIYLFLLDVLKTIRTTQGDPLDLLDRARLFDTTPGTGDSTMEASCASLGRPDHPCLAVI